MFLLGNEVVGPDILSSMINGMTECLEEQEKRGVHFSVKPVCGDIRNADLDSRSFDAIYSLEPIEHARDMPLVLDECARLLKQGGVVMLVNDQNSPNEKGLEETGSCGRSAKAPGNGQGSSKPGVR
jgi:ubiquinone/menaquinone biosynthesis C-methylase UbiE